LSRIVELAATEQGTGSPVLVLHGLFGSARNWATIARRLAERHRVFALDLRNHGASSWTETMSYPEMAADVRAFIEGRRLGAVTLVGHSMGGKVAMTLALESPALIERLAVVDIAPVFYPPSLGAYIDAMRGIDLDRTTRRAEVDAELAASVPEDGIRHFLLQNLVHQEGRLRWRPNLAALAASMPAISEFPEFPEGITYDGPTLFIAGERSDYVQPEHRPAIRRLFPKASLLKLRDAGHWIHAERPDAFIATLLPFLEAG
jgi:pimeloyl-ACP methyl ester carboxylesterase